MKIKLALLSRVAKRYHLLLIASKILRNPIPRIHEWNKVRQRIVIFPGRHDNCFLSCCMHGERNLNLSFERLAFSVDSYSWVCLCLFVKKTATETMHEWERTWKNYSLEYHFSCSLITLLERIKKKLNLIIEC